MEPLNTSGRKVVRVSRKKLWIIVILVVLLVGGWFVMRIMGNSYGSPGYGISGPEMMDKSLNPTSIPEIMPQSNSYPGYYRDSSTPSITDTREFMKKSYNGNIKTRDVSDVARDVKSIVRDVNGRVDGENISDKYAYISFVVAKSEFESFRDEIESLTHKKLYTENISSQNQLSTKQQIEKQDEMAHNSLAELEKQQKDLASAHSKSLASLQSQLSKTRSQISQTRNNKIGTDENSEQYKGLILEEQNLTQQEASIQQSIKNENATYTNQNNNIKNQITGVNSNIDNIKKTDEQFADNIETVNGTVNIQWATYWEMAKIFLPIHPTLAIIILIILGWFYFRHKSYVPKIEFV